MRNQYAGICYRCGETVRPNEGRFERVTKIQREKWGASFVGRWLIQHANCAIVWRGTNRHFSLCPNVDPLPEERK